MASFSRLSSPTADKISDLPDSILCHILSFLPSKQAATTSILSKRWKQVWLSIFTLHFDDKIFKDFNSFRKFVYLTMFSLRDKKVSIHSLTFRCSRFSRFNQKEFDRIIKFVMQRGIENLDFDMFHRQRVIKLPPRILNLKTLQVLKLANIKMGDFDQVDFPLIKTLHLHRIYFISPEYIVKFLLGCPMVEDLYTESLVLNKSTVPMEDVNALPNLVKARVCDRNTPMALLGKAKILHIDEFLVG
ncbi:unnamed protein product [Trifolium pratense]|uniref:Uncharacterized protein n=1 Tax=Trifolium pratense TaxID=57577 RepID=A0ACB0J3J3_TRIPR|nr:unnamed protein product [Trifolium pratense]